MLLALPSGFSEQGCRPHFDPPLMLKALYTRYLGLYTAHGVLEFYLCYDNEPIINPSILSKVSGSIWIIRSLFESSRCSKMNDFLRIKQCSIDHDLRSLRG